jgi:hypothetical protein
VKRDAQEKPQTDGRPSELIGDPAKFDEYSDISWRDERARLDNVALVFQSALQRYPDAIIYLSVYGGRRGCAGEAQARAARAKDYLVNKREIQANRVQWRDDGFREKGTVDVWIMPRRWVKPDPAPTVERTKARIKICQSPRNQRNK